MDPSIIANLSSQDKELLQRVLSIPSVNKALGTEKPKPRSNSPYYCEASANSVKPIADAMIADKSDIFIRYSLYPSWTPNTIKTKLYIASQYLADFDTTPDNRYKDWYERVEFQVKASEGIHIKWKGELIEAVFDRFEKTTSAVYGPKPSLDDWKKELIEFLGDSERKNLKIEELTLSDEDLAFIDTLLDGADITKEITKETIIVLKGRFGI